MNAKTDQANRAAAAARAESLKARAGKVGVLPHTSTHQVTDAIVELAEEFDGNFLAASAALLNMSKLDQIEALGMEDDDPKSYMAARWAA